jgi:hypothetical protein
VSAAESARHAQALPPVTLHPVQGADVWCECGAGGYADDVTFYAYDIGRGWAYACPSCALKAIGDGSAVLSGGGL